jgi:hypothetical protein
MNSGWGSLVAIVAVIGALLVTLWLVSLALTVAANVVS